MKGMIREMDRAKILIDNRQEVEISEELEEAILKAVETVLDYEDEGKDVEVSISFVDNGEIRRLNKEFRNIDRETDVLSFPSIDEFQFDFEIRPRLLGDIVISVEKALEQAEDYGHSFEREILYLTVHSMLHLLGYDHIEQEDKEVMRPKEKDIMKELKVFK